ncbi:MAG: enoyl-CoA hydratase, partial [Verrucomicrobia bacterium]|nr:enoyl-CoA hydratase [Verrucomicrobiota bacterium]
MSNILVEIKEQICTLTVNRPDKLNALNKSTIQELGGCVQKVDEDKEVRAIIITGAGTKAFV